MATKTTSTLLFEKRLTDDTNEFRMHLLDRGVNFFSETMSRDEMARLVAQFDYITEAFPKIVEVEARTGPDAEWVTF